MLRITEIHENENTLRLRFDGTIAADSLAELDQLLARHEAGTGEIIILDLAGVDFMTDQSAAKLATFRSERRRIINCSPYIETLLESVQSIESKS